MRYVTLRKRTSGTHARSLAQRILYSAHTHTDRQSGTNTAFVLVTNHRPIKSSTTRQKNIYKDAIGANSPDRRMPTNHTRQQKSINERATQSIALRAMVKQLLPAPTAQNKRATHILTTKNK